MHCDSFDPGLVPNDAIGRVWSKAGEELYEDVKKYLIPALRESYTNTKEFRIVGHSIGGQMAAYLSFLLKNEQNEFNVTRLDLLDPYYTNAPVPEESPIYEAGRISRKENEILNKVINSIFFRNRLGFPKKAIPTVAYVSFGGVLNEFVGLYRIWETEPAYDTIRGEWTDNITSKRSALDQVHIQTFGRDWLDALDDLSDGSIGGLIKDLFALLSQQHLKIRDYYMESIDPTQDAPKYIAKSGRELQAFSAKFPTAKLQSLSGRRLLKQEEGRDTYEAFDDTYVRERSTRSCAHGRPGRITFYCRNF